MNYLDIARRYHAAGHHVIPVNEDKRPTGPWKQYQARQTAQDLEALFSADCWGIAILTGVKGLEVIDVDEKYDAVGNLFLRYVRHNDEYSANEAAICGMIVQSTKNGGYHVAYRCPVIEGNKKLAMRPATTEELAKHNASGARPIDDAENLPCVLIETRGEGGYIVAHPTPGYAMQWGSFEDVPEITERQRYYLLQSARCFNEIVQRSAADSYIAQERTHNAAGVTPLDDYAAKVNGVDLLTSYGWEYVYEDSQRVYLRRPGNTEAKTSGNYHKEKGLFLCWSTSTPLDPGKGYSPAAIYTTYEHGGDFKAAARTLYAAGYGERTQSQPTATTEAPQQPTTQEPDDLKRLLAYLKSARYDITKPIREEAATLTLNAEGKIYKLGGYGMIGGIVGAQKAGKTLVMSSIVASGLSQGKEQLGFSFSPDKSGVAYFDTEQPDFFFKTTQERIHHMANKYAPVANYEAYPLRRLTVQERIRAIGSMLKGRKDLGLIVIDGLVDLCENFNNEAESQRTIEHLMRWSDETGAMLLTVLHLTKSEGFMRGHLGTALQNKYDFGMEVKKDPEMNTYTVKCRESRFAPFPGFAFERDEKGFPYLPGHLPFDPSLNGRLRPAATFAPIKPNGNGYDDVIPF